MAPANVHPSTGSIPPQRPAHRTEILNEINHFRSLKGNKLITIEALTPLFSSVAKYLQQDAAAQDDDFGDIDDEDLMAVESASLKRGCLDGPEVERLAKKPKGSIAEDSITLAQNILTATWGFSSFRHQQAAAITRLISGGSAVVVFPTGGGKSLVYQIPALAFNRYDEICGTAAGGGVTLVVSPLIALMKDQVDALRAKGVAAAAMDSSQSREAWLETCKKLRSEELNLLYVAPERLNNEGFVEMISHTKVRLVAVDEAHCISEWGHAFRPDYLKVARFTREIQAERVLCLTATATPHVTNDICSAFGIDHEGVFRTTTYRTNLRLLAASFTSGSEKEKALVGFLRDIKGASIVYVQTHAQTETVCTILKGAGFNAFEYHAGMPSDARTMTQEKFMKSKNIIIVATIAFGMGIDKPDIRAVVHYAVPKSLEGYSQEIGRAGRDGLLSTCMIFLCNEDIAIMEQWSRADVPSFRSIQGLVGELLETYRHLNPGEIMERNLSHESKDWDIRINSLDLLNAQLELRFDLIRAVTPKYSEYKFLKMPDFEKKTSDKSSLARTLEKVSNTKLKWTHIDVDQASRVGGCPRADVVRKLQGWNDIGAIQLTPSGVVSRFRCLKKFPEGEAAKRQLITSIYEQIKAREQSDMQRVQGVIDLITTNGCLCGELAKHFGDEKSIPSNGCGNCNFCFTNKAVEFSPGKHQGRKGRIDKTRFNAVLSATKVRDDAQFLARVAFGISSPRVTIEKLGKHEVFGSMQDCDFEELVERFESFCE